MCCQMPGMDPNGVRTPSSAVLLVRLDVFQRVKVPRIETSLPRELIQAHIQTREVQEISLSFPSSVTRSFKPVFSSPTPG